MREQKREVKKRTDGAFEVVSTKVFQGPALIQLRDRLRGDVAATKNLLTQLEDELANVEAACALLGDGQNP